MNYQSMLTIYNSTLIVLCRQTSQIFIVNCGEKMPVAISANKLFRVLYWTLYLGLCFISGWFVSGVFDNYVSRKTSFSQDEEIATKRPIITFNMYGLSGEKPVLYKNTRILYCPSYHYEWSMQCKWLAFGENEIFIKKINGTEKVFFEHIESTSSFRIIPLTNLLVDNAKANINIYTLKAKLKIRVYMSLTSFDNSLGHIFRKNKDGERLNFQIDGNQFKQFSIKPESYKFLPETSKCHQESYYDCLALELDKFDFNQTSCTTKCIPGMFSYGKNYSTPFCQNLEDDTCARDIFNNIKYKIENNFTNIVNLRCKHACTILQYSGKEVAKIPVVSEFSFADVYLGRYQFENVDNKMKVFNQYLIYDSMAMIGSVGGTFGMFIGFSMTGVISSIIEFFKERKIGGKF